MITDYSKSLGDLAKEESIRIDNEEALFLKQNKANLRLAKAPDRKHCVLCASQLTGEEFLHRKVPFISCKTCGHIQTKAQPPIGFPDEIDKKEPFTKIYPKLEKREFEDRKRRIYLPKLHWILSALERSGYDRSELLRISWMELGSGDGTFLSSLQDTGVTDFIGFEREEALVDRSRSVVGLEKVRLSKESVGEIIRKNPAELICSFFVFEHLEDLAEVTSKLASSPAGTILCFSVPVYGFSCILENAFPDRYARNMDAATHTQLFTDESIDYFLDASGFSKIAEWLFGQDANDIVRLLSTSKLPENPNTKILTECRETLQIFFDRNRLSDQRHLIAVRSS